MSEVPFSKAFEEPYMKSDEELEKDKKEQMLQQAAFITLQNQVMLADRGKPAIP